MGTDTTAEEGSEATLKRAETRTEDENDLKIVHETLQEDPDKRTEKPEKLIEVKLLTNPAALIVSQLLISLFLFLASVTTLSHSLFLTITRHLPGNSLQVMSTNVSPNPSS